VENVADRNWIEEALAEHEASLVRYTASILGDLEKSRDVVQEAFFRLCKQKPDIQKRLPQWLFRVCRNLAVDVCRREGRMENVSNEHSKTVPDTRPNPAAVLESAERLDKIALLFRGLSDNQQEVLRLKFQNGLSYREIGEVTGLSVSNIGFLIHTGIKQLRERMEALESRRPQIRRVK
jgi:RNA polymerase sigma-70 factor (ECF subfamily)